MAKQNDYTILDEILKETQEKRTTRDFNENEFGHDKQTRPLTIEELQKRVDDAMKTLT